MRIFITAILTLFVSFISQAQTFNSPESIVYDPSAKRYIVSNAGSLPNGGSIVTYNPSDNTTELLNLSDVNNPKGMILLDGILYIADVTYIRALNASDGSLVFSKEIDGSELLNDICADSSGNLYITELMGEKIYKFNIAGKTVEELALSRKVYKPNGIIYEQSKNRLLVVSWITQAPVFAVNLDNLETVKIKETAYSYLDGITKDNNGNYIISAWNVVTQDSKEGIIVSFPSNFIGNGTPIDNLVGGPADLYFNTHTDSLAVPLFNENKIKFYKLAAKTPPQPPLIIQPADKASIVDKNVEFVWHYVTLADKYQLDISAKDDFSDIILSEEIPDTTYKWDITETGKTYYWRLKSINAAGESNWTSARSFKSENIAFEAPELIYPPDSAKCLKLDPELKWTASQTQLYALQVSTNPSFSGTLKVDAKLISIDTVLQLPNLSLDKNTRYYWRVRTYSGNNTSPWSEVRTFITFVDAPGTPTLFEPFLGEGSKPLQPIFKWSSTINTEYYELRISKDIFKNDSIIFKVMPTAQQEIYQLNKKLEAGIRYYWKVVAFNSCGPGTPSTIYNFYTRQPTMATPILVSPENDEYVEGNPVFIWRKVSGATDYLLQVQSGSDDFTLSKNYPTVDTIKMVTDLDISKTIHYWRVKALGNSDESPWSEVRQFVTENSSVYEPADKAGISVSPNPANDIMRITLGDNKSNIRKISIFNSTGKNVLNIRQFGEVLEIPTDKFRNGLYIINFYGAGSVYFAKVIINK